MKYCVIMCGGAGTRFWPHSRDEYPKQFLDFFGTGRSLLQLTADRVTRLMPKENIFLLTNRRYAPLIREQLPDIPEANILKEPARRNTAPCICWAAHHIQAIDPDASIVILPSDHLILKEDAFVKTISAGFDFVSGGDRLLTIGIKPTSPHTGYGYIQFGAKVGGPVCSGTENSDEIGEICDNFYKVRSFTEKPNEDMAKLFLQSGDFYWNAGMFLWRADSILKAFEKYDPETAAVFDKGAGVWGTPEEEKFIEENYPSAPSISIDYAIMEKADNVFVETADLGWSDVGSWKALYETSPKDQNGNVTQNSRVLENDCHDTIFAVRGDKIVVAAGLNDYIVADNGNALLIYPKELEQKIRQVVNEVRDKFGPDYV